MANDGRPPRLRSGTLRQRAALSGQIFNAKQQARQQAADEFETQEPRDIPIEQRDGRGFAPTSGFLECARPIEAASRLDEQFPRQDVGPADVQQTDQGFEPTQQVRATAAAFELDEQFGAVDIGREDVRPADGGFGLTPTAERQVTAERIESQTPLSDVDPQADLTRDDGGFELDQSASERLFDLDPSFF